MTRKSQSKLAGKNYKLILLAAGIALSALFVFIRLSLRAFPPKQETQMKIRSAGLREENASLISTELKTHTTTDGFLIKAPSNWNFYVGNKYSDGARLYLLSNTVHQGPIPRKLGGKDQYVHIEFYVSEENLEKKRQGLYDYFNRNPDSPNSSTFLFYGTTPAKFFEEFLIIDGREAIGFVIEEESWEQERIREKIIVKLDENKVLSITRYLTEYAPPAELTQAYRQAEESIIERIRFLE